MAARRGRTQARRSGGGSNGLPGWAWLVIGVLATLLVIVMAPKFLNKEGGGGFFRTGAPHADPDAQPRGSGETDGAFEPVAAEPRATPAKPADNAGKGGDFDFYELLPGEEVAMTDAQIAAIAREEARRRDADAAAAARAAAAATAPTDPALQAADAQARAAAAAAGLPQPLPEASRTPAPTATTPAPRQQVASATPAPKPASQPTEPAFATSKPPTATTPYILQAGAFQASGDAEAVKAKIALLGLNARVESANINGKTMYRVRMGPYGSASELAEAKAKLGNGGLPAVAIKAK